MTSYIWVIKTLILFSSVVANHDFIFFHSDTKLPFNNVEQMTFDQILAKVNSLDLSNSKMILTILTDDLGKTDIDYFVQSENLLQKLQFKDISEEGIKVGYYSLSQSIDGTFANFVSNLTQIKSKQMKNITNNIVDYSLSLEQLKNEIKNSLDENESFFSIFLLHSSKQVGLQNKRNKYLLENINMEKKKVKKLKLIKVLSLIG